LRLINNWSDDLRGGENMEDLISIIVPIYNVEQYLKRCVNSLINQTYKNIEIILVDDGSLDNCPKLCDEYAKKDSRIKVVHKQNGGLSDARNVGLRIATGDYIGFIDSDDWASTYMFEELISILKNQKSDIVECKVSWTSKEAENNNKSDVKEVNKFNSEEALKHLILDNILHQTVWNKLYSRAVIGDIEFEVGKTNEDEYWTYQIFAKANSISYVKQEMYYYFQRNNSIMGNNYSIKRLDAVEAKKQRLMFLCDNYPSLVPLAKLDLRNTCMYSYQKSLKYFNRADLKTAKEKIFAASMFTKMNMKEKRQMSIKERVWYITTVISFTMTCRVRNLFKLGV
jgi:glycosyltransferase involved in cell wall biosynthesis